MSVNIIESIEIAHKEDNIINSQNMPEQEKNPDIIRCINILQQKVYNNKTDLLNKIELIYSLIYYLESNNIKPETIQAIIKLIEILRLYNTSNIKTKLDRVNLTTIIPALCKETRMQILKTEEQK